MFYHIEGTVSLLQPNLVVIDCGGLGFAVNTSRNTIARLSMGKKAKLYTYLNVKEDTFELYGFATPAEKRCFEMLISVSGVGPKAAIAILSSTTPEGVTMAVINSDEKALTAAQGVGKKIAQRIILELKDKMQKEYGGSDNSGFAPVLEQIGEVRSRQSDAVAALGVLGYSSSDIAAALRGQDLNGLSTEEIIRLALKNMM